MSGRRILVTGASRGIGRALAQGLLEGGARVAVCSRRASDLEPLRRAGALAVAADVSKTEDVDRLFEMLLHQWRGLDAAVNNAAVLHPGKVLHQPLHDWEETVAVNLTGPLLVSRGAAKVADRGNIVNVTSGLGSFPMEPYGGYCVSKAGLNMLTRVLAIELGGRFRVNAVDPGEIRTQMNPRARVEPRALVAVVTALLTLEASGPTGRCFGRDGMDLTLGERRRSITRPAPPSAC